jgi:hypothetical protein
VKTAGIAICVFLGAAGATTGYFLPADFNTGAIFGILAVVFGAADMVIQSSLKLIDDRIKQEIGKVKTAYRVVMPLTRTRQGLLEMNLVAMICKGVTVASGAMAMSGKAPSWVLAVGGGAFGLGVTLTSVIWVSHKYLAAKANEDALAIAEESNAADAVRRLGDIRELVDLPEPKIVRLAEDKSAPRRKPKTPKR